MVIVTLLSLLPSFLVDFQPGIFGNDSMTHSKFDSSGADSAPFWPNAEADQHTADPVPQPPPPEVYSLRQVAKMFGRTERTINNWVRAGHLQRGGFGKAVFFSRATIDALLNGRVDEADDVSKESN